MKALTHIPFFRITLPLVMGILMAILINVKDAPLYLYILLLATLSFLYFLKDKRSTTKFLFLVLTDIFLILFGVNRVNEKNHSLNKNFYSYKTDVDSVVKIIAVINDLPVEKQNFLKCELKVLEIKSAGVFQTSSGFIYGYFKKSNAAKKLKAGQTLLIKTRLAELSPPKNPFEFDYKNYLNNRQIYHTAFIDSLAYHELPVATPLNSLWLLGLRCKAAVLYRLKESELSQNAYGICTALLTGYDDEIDRPVMEAFSHSGTLHVLSVSGLHTGLIYLVINFLLNFFDRKKKYKLSRFIFITLVLWFFALLTGFSAPVLRAVIMFNLLGFGKIYFRGQYKHQLNILLVSAFFLLVYNPYYICDVGFLLSYFALFGLIYFQPKISQAWSFNNILLNSTWQSVSASVAATLSTLPITLFYFKQFPLWFFVCNVVVVPATFILLFMALFVVFKINFMAVLINYLVSALIRFINLFDSKEFGFIDNIDFNFYDAVFLSVFIVLGSLAFQYRAYKSVILSLLVLITWQFYSLVDSYGSKNKNQLVVYNVKKKKVSSVKNKNEVHLTRIDTSSYNFNIKPQITSYNYPTVKFAQFNVVKSKTNLILFLEKSGFWPDIDLKKVSSVVVSNDFKIYKEDLKKLENLKIIVSDASNNNYQAMQLAKLSSTFGIEFYNIKQKGAYILALR